MAAVTWQLSRASLTDPLDYAKSLTPVDSLDTGLRRKSVWRAILYNVNHGPQHRAEGRRDLDSPGKSPHELDFSPYVAKHTPEN
jgi:hypothetical protein